jgi:MinD superfamily P-loop ATPase
MVFPELCHACGACGLVCPQQALGTAPHEIGTITRASSGPLRLLSGCLDVGQARATPVVEAVVAAGIRTTDRGLVVIDAPPGTSCSAMAAVRRADLVVLVTEPTPFGLHDLELAVRMCDALARPVAAVVNRSDLGDHQALHYLLDSGIPVLGQIPFQRSISSAYAQGQLAAGSSPALQLTLEAIADHLDHKAASGSTP